MLAQWVEQLLSYASGALEAIRDDEHYPSLMRWARQEGVKLLGQDMALAQALAPELWNQTPLIRLDFNCEPLARPDPDEPCWCDSGLRFNQCCGHVELPGAIPPHLMWMLSLKSWKGPMLRRALNSCRVPAQSLLEAGIIGAETGQLGRAQIILEALFQCPDWNHLPEQSEPAFELLTNLYQERGFSRKKAALFDNAVDHGPPFLRGAALERLCLMYLDSDDLNNARETFLHALQTIPNSPALAYIETMLLLHEGHGEEARERANFWWRRLSKRDDIEPEQLDFLATLAENPAAALAEQMIYSEEELAEPLAIFQEQLTYLEDAPPLALAVNAKGYLEYQQSDIDSAYYSAWQHVFSSTVDKDSALGLNNDPWFNAREWLGELCLHPSWLSSPPVTQELAMSLTSRFGNLPWMVKPFFEPLVQRFDQWLGHIEARQKPFLWDDGDNAIVFRLGLALVIGMERGDRRRSRELAERLLKLDDEDNLGLRELVLEQLLREDRNIEALKLIESIEESGDDDRRWLGLLIGRALALFRLSRRDEARQALENVQAANAHVLSLLINENPRREPLSDDAPSPGSRAEAWQYRILMRDQWVTTQGALEWLSSVLKKRAV
ncbi:SEC-C domain-containing protein [Phytohalomonas tamaricis]|uniref:SEC-C domain-containing protein n=1 Tax=Phytohalomonas tamaricis TaxID=2081032 RepID=UPI000D0B6D7F|nr:SEC-C domain-containing protein [Phytohalomonas tamaricis]